MTIRHRAALVLCCAAAGLLAPARDAALALTPAQIEIGSRRAPVSVRETTTRLASDAFLGRDNLTEGSEIAQAYLIPLLRALGAGADGGTSDESYKHRFAQGTNLIAVIPGRELPDEYVLIGGHYDHLGVASSGEVFNGATDNATGTAIAIAVGRAIRALPEAPRRSVVIALWDAEEDGLLGSIAWVGQPTIPIEQIVAYVNLDIQGANLTPTLARTSIAVGAETGGQILEDVVANAVQSELRAFPRGVETLPVSYIFGQLRSDYATLVGAGVPTVFFSDSTGACYHTVRDDTRFVDFDKAASQSRIAFRTTVTLAEAESVPAFVAPNPNLAVFADAVTLDAIFTRSARDLARFGPEDRQRVQRVVEDVAAIVARGPEAFGPADVTTVLAAAVDTLGAIESSFGCAGYFGRTSPFEVPRNGAHQHGQRRPRTGGTLPRDIAR
jgi:hypothetical protein